MLCVRGLYVIWFSSFLCYIIYILFELNILVSYFAILQFETGAKNILKKQLTKQQIQRQEAERTKHGFSPLV